MPLTLIANARIDLPMEGPGITPDRLARLPADAASREPIHIGKETAELGDVFQVSGTSSDDTLVIEGDLPTLARVGEGMACGRLIVRGTLGLHTGARMTGGRLEVNGALGAWAGAEMGGGVITIDGNAGDFLGGAYPGSRRGMRGGTILVRGIVGNQTGLLMRRGLIAASGAIGELTGHSMIAGTILAFGEIGRAPGFCMRRGTIVLFAETERARATLLPTFAASGCERPVFLALLFSTLAARGFEVPPKALESAYERYNGDLAQSGQGEILIQDTESQTS